jgi:hypothetical protein
MILLMSQGLKRACIWIIGALMLVTLSGAAFAQEEARPKERDTRERRESERKANENQRLARDVDTLAKRDETLTRKGDSAEERNSGLSRESSAADRRSGIPEDAVKLRGDQGFRDKDGNIWKRDQLHKDHWDVSDRKGNKVKEVDYNGRQIWPDGPKNKNK